MAETRAFGVSGGMTPEEHLRIQKLFLKVIAMPRDQREAYVRENAVSDDVRDEVLSLLSFHSEETVIDQAAHQSDSLPRALDQTVELGGPPPRAVQTASSLTHPFADGDQPILKAPAKHLSGSRQLDVEPSVDVSERFAKSTNRLLRERLMVAVFVIAGLLVSVTAFSWFMEEIRIERLINRGITLAILGLCGWALFHYQGFSRRSLRLLELVIVVAPLVDLSIIQWTESGEILRGSEKDFGIPELRAVVFAAASVYIAVYGMFIPSNWRRTALVTGSIAVLPLVLLLVHQQVYAGEYEKYFSNLNDMLNAVDNSKTGSDGNPDQAAKIANKLPYVSIILTVVMSIVATIGAGIVHRVRRAAESARYYGQYQLTSEIGRGGMGIVYLGKHSMLKRPAAIKLINSESAGSPEAIERFEREVQATATLSHWNTVQIYDYGTTDGGDFYCVMEYLDGVTLQQRLNRVHAMPLPETMEIVIQLCDGLEEAHLKGMVHRDIKPANIFLASIGGCPDVVKLLDFGLVVTKEETEGEDGIVVGGTPAYMSPEQIRGEALDGRSDIYAIGCIIYECLTGEQLFNSFPISKIISDHLFRKPKLDAVSKIDPDLVGFLEKCLAKVANDRYANVAELRETCQRWLEQTGPSPS